ncbi:MAG: Abi family protein [Bacteroidota bacterium]
MKYAEFQNTMSEPRMSRYLTACSDDSKKAMTLYRLNLRLSQELFTVISCFEIALRNKIDQNYTSTRGSDWLRNSIKPSGMFRVNKCRNTAELIRIRLAKLGTSYSHNKLVSLMDFGFWRYLYAKPQFHAGGQSLMNVFPSRPVSTPNLKYNHTFIFNELDKVNGIRNRIAHHEAICFRRGMPIIDTLYVRQHYGLVIQFFQWMNIDEGALLYGLDHVIANCNKIDNI